MRNITDYKLSIGNAVLYKYNKKNIPMLLVIAEREKHKDAPDIYGYDKYNLMDVSYIQLRDMSKDAGLYELLFDLKVGIVDESTGYTLLSKYHLDKISQAKRSYEMVFRHRNLTKMIPTSKCEDDPYGTDEYGDDIYDWSYTLLVWLEYWVGYAIKHHDTPIISIY